MAETLTIHQQLAFLLEHQPPQMHLVITTREDPPLPVSRLRARGQMVEIQETDLRFTVQETGEFLRQTVSLQLSPTDITALHRRTEGWIAGLQLAACSLGEGQDVHRLVESFTGSHRYILDYLIVEIRVKGHIDEHRSGWFDDLEITHTDQDETLLRGLVANQSAAFGLLARVRDLGLALASMTISEADNQEGRTSSYTNHKRGDLL